MSLLTEEENAVWQSQDPVEASTEDLIAATERVTDAIERHGWTKGSFVNYRGQLCLVGAGIRSGLSSVHPWYSEFAGCVYAPTGILLQDPPYGRLMWWNDNEAKSQEEVLTKLRDFMYELKSR